MKPSSSSLPLVSIDWQARWIWAASAEPSPRNEWWCFRRTFRWSGSGHESAGALLHLTADSRYVIYVNGHRLGWGPVRSWPERLSYDTYEIGHLLRRGAPNVIAVLVQHWGVGTFYYRRGRGGLLVQLEAAGQKVPVIVSDASWRASRFAGQDARAVRMSVQHAFAEIIDGREVNDEWLQPGFNDERWDFAAEIGSAGMAPWNRLQPRDVPFLTEEPVVPRRVVALRRVQPPAPQVAADFGVHFVPEAADDANEHLFSGLVATLLRARRRQRARLCFPWGLRRESVHLVLNGRLVPAAEFQEQTPQVCLETELQEGENELLLDVSGPNRWPMTWVLQVQAEDPVEFVSPWDGSTGVSGPHSPFAAVGPFEKFVTIDHQDGFKKKLDLSRSDYLTARSARSFADWRVAGELVRPVARRLTHEVCVLADRVMRAVVREEAVPPELQLLAGRASNPVTVDPAPDGDTELTLDFGEQRSGFLTFTVEANEGTVLDFYGYEHEDRHGVQHTYHLENTLRYTCRAGVQTFRSLVRRGMRYLQVTIRGTGHAVKWHRIELIQSSYPVAEIAAFACSDDRLNRIWEMTRRTVRLCMEDTFVDCPAYEQTYWVGDAYNVGLINYRLFGATDIVRRCLRLVPSSKGLSPLLCDQVPSGWNSVIPNWTFFWVMACAEYLESTDDETLLHELLPEIRATLEAYARQINAQGLLEIAAWNLLDWAPMDQPNEGVVTHQNFFFLQALKRTADLASWAKDQGTTRFARQTATRLKAGINRHLWSKQRGAFLDCIRAGGLPSDKFSLQTQVVALVCEAVSPARRKRLLGLLARPPATFVKIGSPFMSFFLHWAWTEAGEGQRVLDDTRKNWGVMLDHDATTCWEQFPGFAEGRPVAHFLTRSHTHAWSAAPGYFMSRTVLGVERLDRGWRRVRVQPQLGDLSWARGRVPLPQGGWVEVECRRDHGGRVDLSVRAPKGVKIEVRLPKGGKKRVTIGP